MTGGGVEGELQTNLDESAIFILMQQEYCGGKIGPINHNTLPQEVILSFKWMNFRRPAEDIWNHSFIHSLHQKNALNTKSSPHQISVPLIISIHIVS